MFLPGRNVQQELAERQRIYRSVEEMATSLIPSEYRSGCSVSLQEVQCGDPQCAPIDTVITLLFESGGQGVFGLPMEAKEVNLEELKHHFPTPEVIAKWHAGEEAEWPPMELPELRFDVGTPVLCRVGAGNDNWQPGHITQLWYREPQWPEGAMAPYKIKLDDGRDIFAPADVDQVIRINSNKQAA